MIKKELKNISIICFGSRGDFQPYLALGVELKTAGYNVRILSSITFKSFSEDLGIDFVTLYNRDVATIIKKDQDILESMANGDLRKLLDGINKGIELEAPYTCEVFMEEMKNNRPDLFVCGSLGDYFAYYANLILNIPTVEVKLQTFTFNPKRGLMGIPTLPNEGHYSIMMRLSEQRYDGWIHYEAAMKSMDCPQLRSVLPKADYMTYKNKLYSGAIEQIICQPRIFKSILSGIDSEKIHYVGPSIIDAKKQKEHSGSFGGKGVQNKIEAFLDEIPDKKPIYCGWGSMICKSPEFMVEFVASSLRYSGERGIVLGGWANLSLELLEKSTTDRELITYARDNILFIDAASHENLFPRVKCIIHHGGSGTTNAVLRSGCPTIITPVFADQFDHAHVVNKLGVGIGFSEKQFQKITAEELGEAIKTVVANPEMKIRAMEVKEDIVQENGSRSAMAVIEQYWENKRVSMKMVKPTVSENVEQVTKGAVSA